MAATKGTAAYMTAESTDMSASEPSMTAAESRMTATKPGVAAATALCPQRNRQYQHKRRDGSKATHTTTL